MNKYLRPLVVAVASVTFLVPAAQADAAGCVSKREFHHVHHGMSMSRVHRIFGTDGRRTSVHGVISIRRYPPCPAHSLVRVYYRRGHLSAKGAFWHVG
jgi:hypothetical protein